MGLFNELNEIDLERRLCGEVTEDWDEVAEPISFNESGSSFKNSQALFIVVTTKLYTEPSAILANR